jgi:hypothetical protein
MPHQLDSLLPASNRQYSHGAGQNWHFIFSSSAVCHAEELVLIMQVVANST